MREMPMCYTDVRPLLLLEDWPLSDVVAVPAPVPLLTGVTRVAEPVPVPVVGTAVPLPFVVVVNDGGTYSWPVC